MANEVDLGAYFERIEYAGSPAVNLDTLRDLHLLHPIAIPFENLATLMRQPVPLDIDAVQKKLIHDRRGGYCFEQNRLFCDVLQAIGFQVVSLAARVVWNSVDDPRSPRTHMILLVEIGSESYLSDVGFGGLTLTGPLLFETAIEQVTPHESFRITQISHDEEYQVEARVKDAWRPLYRFDLQPQRKIDYEVSNHYVATHSDSHFLTTLMAARATIDGRYSLLNNELSAYSCYGDEPKRQLSTVLGLRETLTEIFSINLPEGDALETALKRLIQ